MLPSDEPALPSLRNDAALRGFCARILGWTNDAAIDHAIHSLDLAADHHAALVLLGETDLVPIARALHRRLLGADRPFVVCDPRRRGLRKRALADQLRHRGCRVRGRGRGSLCVRSRRLPRDFSSVVARIRATRDVQIIVCSDRRDDTHPFLTLPV